MAMCLLLCALNEDSTQQKAGGLWVVAAVPGKRATGGEEVGGEPCKENKKRLFLACQKQWHWAQRPCIKTQSSSGTFLAKKKKIVIQD